MPPEVRIKVPADSYIGRIKQVQELLQKIACCETIIKMLSQELENERAVEVVVDYQEKLKRKEANIPLPEEIRSTMDRRK